MSFSALTAGPLPGLFLALPLFSLDQIHHKVTDVGDSSSRPCGTSRWFPGFYLFELSIPDVPARSFLEDSIVSSLQLSSLAVIPYVVFSTPVASTRWLSFLSSLYSSLLVLITRRIFCSRNSISLDIRFLMISASAVLLLSVTESLLLPLVRLFA